MHVRQRVAYKTINKNKKMKTIINSNTFLSWPPSKIIIILKVNLIKLRLTSNKRNKKLKYAYHHNTRKYR